MDELRKKLMQLSAAEEFLDFFNIRYDPAVVNVSRLHILKRFYQYLRRDTELGTVLEEALLYARYQTHLAQAYDDFVKSTPAQEKVFKVFQDANGQQSIALDSLRSTLRSGA